MTESFPRAWRFTATVKRYGQRDARGVPSGARTHEVKNCMAAVDMSESQGLQQRPDTETNLYAPPGADFRAGDIVTIPPSPLWPHGEFDVPYEPSVYPLGVRVRLERRSPAHDA